jgi:hypothetical protein
MQYPNDVVRCATRGEPMQAVGARLQEFKPIRSVFRCDPIHSFAKFVSVSVPGCHDAGRSNLHTLSDATDNPMSGEFGKMAG